MDENKIRRANQIMDKWRGYAPSFKVHSNTIIKLEKELESIWNVVDDYVLELAMEDDAKFDEMSELRTDIDNILDHMDIIFCRRVRV